MAEAERLQQLLAEHAARHDRETSLPNEGFAAMAQSRLNTALLEGASWLTFGRIVSILSRGSASFGALWLMHQGSGITFLALPEPALVASFSVEGGWRLPGAKRFVSGCERAKYRLTLGLEPPQPQLSGKCRSNSPTHPRLLNARRGTAADVSAPKRCTRNP